MNSKSLTIAAIVAASTLMATAFTVAATPQQAFADSETDFKVKQKQKQDISGFGNLGAALQCGKNIDLASAQQIKVC
jgi:O-glycosyl hydrolase